MPGSLVEMMLAAPGMLTLTVSRYDAMPNSARTVFAASIVTTHVVVPLQSPDQPTNDDPVSGVANSITIWPSL